MSNKAKPVKRPKTVAELKETALLWWPKDLAEKERKANIIPLLLETQESFISLLHIASKDPFAWEKALDLCHELYPNLFLKHLCVLSDIGGESLKRFSTELPAILRKKSFEFTYKKNTYSYKFASLAARTAWSNQSLGLNGQGLFIEKPLDQAVRDVIILLLFGSLSVNVELPGAIEAKCVVGSMLGDKKRLDRFVKERYIWVSRITGGATANTLGHLAQQYVKERLQEYLRGWTFSKTTIPDISQNLGRTKTKFDIVACPPKPSQMRWGIEVSFQFTTNSTVERKAKLAAERHRLLNEKGHKVAYVIDGAGNFERQSFVKDLIDNSDCIVNFSDCDIKRLAETMKKSIFHATSK